MKIEISESTAEMLINVLSSKVMELEKDKYWYKLDNEVMREKIRLLEPETQGETEAVENV